ncbi:MAG: hypothetical protein HOO06_06365 [Bdellovibrionaceae bacterium]|jgi:hypothetical protein|nr:hypothetical protein [Pseudobdellovibrionaceae bacterium]
MKKDETLNSIVPPEKLKKWQTLGKKTAVEILGSSGNISQGEIFIQQWNKSERLAQAVKWGSIYWALAVICVFIPILHFVLVPAFVLAGPIAFYINLKREKLVLGGFGTCPKCGENLPIEKSKVEWPLADLCTHCHNTVKISLMKS